MRETASEEVQFQLAVLRPTQKRLIALGRTGTDPWRTEEQFVDASRKY